MINWLIGLLVLSYVSWIVYYHIKGWMYGSSKCSSCRIEHKCIDLKNKY